jgi:hypothetical protein
MIWIRRVILSLAIASLPLLTGCSASSMPSQGFHPVTPVRLYVSNGVTTNGTTSFYNLPITPLSPVAGSLTTPNVAFSLCVDGSGRLWATQDSNSATGILAYAQPIASGASPSFSINVGAQSAGCVFDGSGNLYVSLSNNKVAVIPAPVTSASVPTSFITSGVSFPGDVTVDSSGDVFVCNSGPITEYSPLAGGNTLLHTFGGVASLSPAGCAIGPDGNLYVANGTTLGEIDVYKAPFSNSSPVDHSIAPPTAVNIWDIKFDIQNNMYVAGDSTTGSDVWVFAPPYTGATSALLLVSTSSGNEARGLALTN